MSQITTQKMVGQFEVISGMASAGTPADINLVEMTAADLGLGQKVKLDFSGLQTAIKSATVITVVKGQNAGNPPIKANEPFDGKLIYSPSTVTSAEATGNLKAAIDTDGKLSIKAGQSMYSSVDVVPEVLALGAQIPLQVSLSNAVYGSGITCNDSSTGTISLNADGSLTGKKMFAQANISGFRGAAGNSYVAAFAFVLNSQTLVDTVAGPVSYIQSVGGLSALSSCVVSSGIISIPSDSLNLTLVLIGSNGDMIARESQPNGTTFSLVEISAGQY